MSLIIENNTTCIAPSQYALYRTKDFPATSIRGMKTKDEKPPTRLRQAREAAGYKTAADFARAFDFELPAYRHHENGTRPRIPYEAAKKYAPLLGVTVAWLRYEEDKPGNKGQLYTIDEALMERSSKAMRAVALRNNKKLDSVQLTAAATKLYNEVVKKRNANSLINPEDIADLIFDKIA